MQTYTHSKTHSESACYDYIFSGMGASASLLLLELHRNNQLSRAKILLVDPEKKERRDKTFCFWSHDTEPIYSDLKPLISHSWDKIELPDSDSITLSPLRYNHISSIDLYRKVQEITETINCQRLYATVEDVLRDETGPYIIANGKKIRAARIFDSRTPVHSSATNAETHIYQSFVGWIIETPEALRRSDAFRFMDFDIEQQGFTQFVYVLPFSSSKALVEVTRFGSQTIQTDEAEILLKQYIEKNYGTFKMLEVEQGCIPMSNSKIENDIVPGISVLGARNYNIKPSTGYAFKNMYYHARQLSDLMTKGAQTDALNRQHNERLKGRFAFYDGLLLDILKNRPKEGKPIFTALLQKVETKTILKFLDEKTSIVEDLGLFFKLPWKPFLSALLRTSVTQSVIRPILLMLLTLSALFIGNITSDSQQNTFIFGIFIVGLIAVGIPHGAVDHLLETSALEIKKLPGFIVKYVSLTVLVGFIWYFAPTAALILFLAYSSWHFGEADGKHWGFSKSGSLAWGASVLFFILGTHFEESNSILATMGNLSLPLQCPVWALLPWLLYALYRKQTALVITILWLSLSSQIPLLLAFGLYFIGEHSLSSWQHLKTHLKMSDVRIWIYALPFHAGAWALLAVFYLLYPSSSVAYQTNYWGTFFVFIACLSLPHAISMHFVYSRKNKQ